MKTCRVVLEWNTMSCLVLVSWMTLGRSAENSQSSQPSSKLFLSVSMPAALSCQDFVPPSDMNTSAFALGRTSRPLRQISLSQVIVTLDCVTTCTCPGLELLWRN
ncbi:hypothetical protein PoB_000466700 [Plakobranchus ocellatus]|uniref:Secreted protein n=1 Tax=Plakobranchus ocellatus TaxID=259542 RepID=A0AAV3Y6S9_9GAST|nr:hypothetical protein PoB_000466700 [Plakobranchus ocellatus]